MLSEQEIHKKKKHCLNGPTLFQTLTSLGNCVNGTFTVNTAGANGQSGTACAHDLQKEYAIFLPEQERYDFVGRASFRLGSSIEGYLAGSYSRNRVHLTGAPAAIRQTQAFGGSPATATSAPGIVLPVYICPSGVNCAIRHRGSSRSTRTTPTRPLLPPPRCRCGAHLLLVRRHPGGQEAHQQGLPHHRRAEGRYRRQLELEHQRRLLARQS